METAEEIRVRLAEMRLAALETAFCNSNWTYSRKLKALKEQLHLKHRAQVGLHAQLAALRQAYAEHQQQVQAALTQAALLDQQGPSASRSPRTRETLSRSSPTKPSNRLFFNVGRQEKKKLYFSPDVSKAPAASSWQKISCNNTLASNNSEKRHTLLRENNSLRSVGERAGERLGAERTVDSSTAHLKRVGDDLTVTLQGRSGPAGTGRRRAEKRGPNGC